MSTAYHLQSNGQSEALNKCLEMYLRCFTFQKPRVAQILALGRILIQHFLSPQH